VQYGGQSMPVANAHRCLQSIVIAAGRGLQLVDDPESGECKISGDGIRLIEVDVTKELPSCRANIADLQRDVPGQFPLDIQVIHLHIRRTHVLVHGKYVGCAKCGWSKDTHSGLNHGGRRKAEGDGIGTDSIVAGTGVEGVERKLADEEILGEGIIVHPPAGPHHRLCISFDIPNQTRPWSKIVEIARIKLLHKLKISSWIENAELVLGLADYAKIFPTHSIVEGQVREQAEVVLKIERVVVLE